MSEILSKWLNEEVQLSQIIGELLKLYINIYITKSDFEMVHLTLIYRYIIVVFLLTFNCNFRLQEFC